MCFEIIILQCLYIFIKVALAIDAISVGTLRLNGNKLILNIMRLYVIRTYLPMTIRIGIDCIPIFVTRIMLEMCRAASDLLLFQFKSIREHLFYQLKYNYNFSNELHNLYLTVDSILDVKIKTMRPGGAH